MIRDSLVDLLRPARFRGKGRLLSVLRLPQRERRVRVFGYDVELDTREFIQRMIWLGDFERWETGVVRRTLEPGGCFVDVGANVGYFSLLAASRVGRRGRVLAFEPSPYAFERLTKTILSNRIEQIQAFAHALGAARGHAELQFTGQVQANHTPSLVPQPGARTVRVEVKPLDDILDELRVRHVDLMKVDVEGFEPSVLRGAEESLRAGRVAAVLIELNEPWLARAGSSGAEVRAMLEGFGFRDATGRPNDVRFENRLFVRR